MLSRHTNLARRTPLTSRSPARARQPLRRTAAPARPAGRGKTSPAVPVPPALRELIYRRDDHRCVRCGRHTDGVPRSLQHRQARGMGGRTNPHTAANLILLCGTGTTGCHGLVECHEREAEGYAKGFAIRGTIADPASTPLLLHLREWMIPSIDDRERGVWLPAHAPEQPA